MIVFLTYALAGISLAIAATLASSLSAEIPIVAAIKLAQLRIKERWRGSAGSNVIAEGHLFGPDQNGCP